MGPAYRTTPKTLFTRRPRGLAGAVRILAALVLSGGGGGAAACMRAAAGAAQVIRMLGSKRHARGKKHVREAMQEATRREERNSRECAGEAVFSPSPLP